MLIGDRKADFSDIYLQSDPRGYFRALRPLEYQVPQHALPVFRAVLAASARAGRPRTVLDVCCSYGINAALLRHQVGMEGLGARFADPALDELTADELIADDAMFYSGLPNGSELTVLGLDASAPAVDYALRTGLMQRGWAEDLESFEPSRELAAGVRDVGLVVCTGGVGYVGHRTFERLLGHIRDPHDLWVAVFVLRMFPYDRIAETFARHGLVTERVPGTTFRQRRFVDRAERDAAVHDVESRGLDPAGKEADGWYHAECFISRPEDSVARTPLAELLKGVCP